MPTVIAIASPIAMICVHVTTTPATVNVQLELFSVRMRTVDASTGERHAISPSRISASPSVPIIFTSGSRRAKAGPNTRP